MGRTIKPAIGVGPANLNAGPRGSGETTRLGKKKRSTGSFAAIRPGARLCEELGAGGAPRPALGSAEGAAR